MELGQYPAAVLTSVFEAADTSDSVDWFEFSLAGEFAGKFVVAAAAIGADGEHIIFNLPTYSTDVFVGLTRGYPTDGALILANLEDYERENDLRLRLGEAIVLPTPAVGQFAVLLLRTTTSADAAGIPDRA